MGASYFTPTLLLIPYCVFAAFLSLDLMMNKKVRTLPALPKLDKLCFGVKQDSKGVVVNPSPSLQVEVGTQDLEAAQGEQDDLKMCASLESTSPLPLEASSTIVEVVVPQVKDFTKVETQSTGQVTTLKDVTTPITLVRETNGLLEGVAAPPNVCA
jgi:hypothetical protein